MPFCSKCGSFLNEGDQTCSICGASQIPNNEETSNTSDALNNPDFNDSFNNIPNEVNSFESFDDNSKNQQEYSQTDTNQPSSNPVNLNKPQNNSYSENTDFTEFNQQPQQQNNQYFENYSNNNFNNNQQQFYNNNINNSNNGKGVASMILGIVSLVICSCYGLGIIPAIIGLVLGIQQNKTNKVSVGTAGIVLSIIGIVFNSLMLIYIIIIAIIFGTLSSEEMLDLMRDLENERYY